MLKNNLNLLNDEKVIQLQSYDEKGAFLALTNLGNIYKYSAKGTEVVQFDYIHSLISSSKVVREDRGNE